MDVLKVHYFLEFIKSLGKGVSEVLKTYFISNDASFENYFHIHISPQQNNFFRIVSRRLSVISLDKVFLPINNRDQLTSTWVVSSVRFQGMT